MLLLVTMMSVTGCARVAPSTTGSAPSMTDSNMTISGQYLGEIIRKEINETEGIFDFSAVNLRPSTAERYILPNRDQYNYMFEGLDDERYWLFAEVAHEGGFTVMRDDEFLQWVRGAIGMQNATMMDIEIYEMEAAFGPVKYSYYFAAGFHCVGFAGIWGAPRNIEGYSQSRDSTINGEFCRQASNMEEMLLYFSLIMDRLKIRNPDG